jgi:hypothetical protein
MSAIKSPEQLAEELRALAQSILNSAGALTMSFQPLDREEYSFSVYHPYTLIQDDMPAFKFFSNPPAKKRLKPAQKWYDDNIPEVEFELTPSWIDAIPGNEFMLTVTSAQFDHLGTAEFRIPAALLQLAS